MPEKTPPGGSKSRGSSLASHMEESAGLALQTGGISSCQRSDCVETSDPETHDLTSFKVHAQKPHEGDGSVNKNIYSIQARGRT